MRSVSSTTSRTTATRTSRRERTTPSAMARDPPTPSTIQRRLSAPAGSSSAKSTSVSRVRSERASSHAPIDEERGGEHGQRQPQAEHTFRDRPEPVGPPRDLADVEDLRSGVDHVAEPRNERQAEGDDAEAGRSEPGGEDEHDDEAEDARAHLACHERREAAQHHPPAACRVDLLDFAHARTLATDRRTRAAIARSPRYESSPPSRMRRSSSGRRR